MKSRQADRTWRASSPLISASVNVSGVVDASGADVSDGYWLDHCYVMQRIVPVTDERKFGSFFRTKSWKKFGPIADLFEDAGVRHLGDVSVLRWRTKRPIIIDFATSDAAGDIGNRPP